MSNVLLLQLLEPLEKPRMTMKKILSLKPRMTRKKKILFLIIILISRPPRERVER